MGGLRSWACNLLESQGENHPSNIIERRTKVWKGKNRRNESRWCAPRTRERLRVLAQHLCSQLHPHQPSSNHHLGFVALCVLDEKLEVATCECLAMPAVSQRMRYLVQQDCDACLTWCEHNQRSSLAIGIFCFAIQLKDRPSTVFSSFRCPYPLQKCLEVLHGAGTIGVVVADVFLRQENIHVVKTARLRCALIPVHLILPSYRRGTFRGSGVSS
jgi:hypothetical protein